MGNNHGSGFLACGKGFIRKPEKKFPGEDGGKKGWPVRSEENCPDTRAYGYQGPMPIGAAMSCLSGWGEEIIDEKSRQLGRLREEQGFVTGEDIEDGEQLFVGEDEEELIASQEEREERRQNPKNMLKAAKSLLRLLYSAADDSVSMKEFESGSMTNSIITCYLWERMDGVIKYYFDNLRDESISSAILDFAEKMAPYKPAVSNDEVNHILPHARIEKFEYEVAIRRISSNSDISGEMKRRLINQASWEKSRHNNGNYLTIHLGEAIFGKNRFNRMLRS